MTMDVEVDHYSVLGLPSGVEGSRLSEQEISKAYRLKARELHPDKRPDDPEAHANFQNLKISYDILRDEKARRLFDDLLHVKRERKSRRTQFDSKRRRMVSDLEERERAAFGPDPYAKPHEEEERIARKLKEEIARVRAMHARKSASASSMSKEAAEVRAEQKDSLDKEKVLKVSWEKVGPGYSAQRLQEIFENFGDVEDVVIKSSKKRGSALVVMASKDSIAAATRSVCGDISNPLLVAPVQPILPKESGVPFDQQSSEFDGLNNLVGVGYQAFEDSVLKKLQKAAEKQR